MQNKNLQNLLKKVNDETANLPITHQESELIILNNETSSSVKGGGGGRCGCMCGKNQEPGID